VGRRGGRKKGRGGRGRKVERVGGKKRNGGEGELCPTVVFKIWCLRQVCDAVDRLSWPHRMPLYVMSEHAAI